MDGEGSVDEELVRLGRTVEELQARLAEKDRRIEALKAENARLLGYGHERFMSCERAYDDLKTVDQLKSDFLSVISHELRTPLTALLGYTDLVLRGVGGPLTSKQEHYLGASLMSARELMGLINSLIEFSILEAGRGGTNLSKVDLYGLVLLTLPPLGQIAEGKGVSLRNEVTPSSPPVLADEPKLIRALEAVLSNAIKFTPRGGSIVVGASSVADHVVIAVEDSGVGLPVERLEKIWEQFYQIDSTPTRKFGGLGLGLAIAKKLVEIQGGRIWAESDGPDRGATFKIELPRFPLSSPETTRP